MLVRSATRAFSSLATRMEATLKPWALTADGRRVDKIVLTNGKGMEATLATWGATILSVKVPNKAGVAEEVTLCYDKLEDLAAKSPYYGSTVGRVANRIAKGKFTIGEDSYKLATNNGPNALHGGLVGFDKVVWSPRVYVKEGAAGVVFEYTSHDGEEGYPGTMKVTADYALTTGNELTMTFAATSDKATPVNICNHTYWNLSGDLKTKIHDHVLTLDCPYYLPVDATQIPTGEVASVVGTDFDFMKPTAVGSRLDKIDGAGRAGYDHCFCRSEPAAATGGGAASSAASAAAGAAATASSPVPSRIAVLEDPASGRKMTVSTTKPGVQLYCGNWLSLDSKDAPHDQHRALCLETQFYPDSINKAHFPAALLLPGEVYSHTTVHKFEF